MNDENEGGEVDPEPPAHRELTFGCCFCGKAADPAIQVIAVWGWSDMQPGDKPDEQYWFAHPSCFVDSLHEQARVFTWNEDEIFGDANPEGA